MGDVIEVVEQREEGGWWAGRLRGRLGWFPSSFTTLSESAPQGGAPLVDLSEEAHGVSTTTPHPNPPEADRTATQRPPRPRVVTRSQAHKMGGQDARTDRAGAPGGFPVTGGVPIIGAWN